MQISVPATSSLTNDSNILNFSLSLSDLLALSEFLRASITIRKHAVLSTYTFPWFSLCTYEPSVFTTLILPFSVVCDQADKEFEGANRGNVDRVLQTAALLVTSHGTDM